MPFNRPTLSELRERNYTYIQSELNVGSLLRFSNLKVISDADAGMAYLHYGYLDYISKQSTPFTSTDEYLEGWAALKNIYRKPATGASCQLVTFTGASGKVVLKGALLNRSDGYQYTVDNDVTIAGSGTGTGTITAVLPTSPDNITSGASGNAPAGTILSLDVAVDGISKVVATEPIIGGADVEDDDSLRARMLLAYQDTPQGGNDEDYELWARQVSGVTRAWTKRRLVGPGTVGIYIMCDGNDHTNHGFPVGTDGISQLEDWGAVKATGYQLRVADHIYPLQPVTALVYVCSPIEKTIDFTIDGISSAGSDVTSAINDAIDNVFFENGDPRGNGKVMLSQLNLAISEIVGTAGFIITSPTANIVLGIGELPVRGTVTYT